MCETYNFEFRFSFDLDIIDTNAHVQLSDDWSCCYHCSHNCSLISVLIEEEDLKDSYFCQVCILVI